MRSLKSILSGRVSSIRRRVVTSSAARGKRPGHAGDSDLNAKLARARAQVRGARHGRRTP
jgi:hypothetical protein